MAQSEVPSIELEYAFSIRIENSGRIQFEGPMRSRVFEPATGGEIRGPKLQGRVVPYSGADFAIFKDLSQGIKANTHDMLEADDGTWIYINNRGFLNRPPDPDNPGQTKLYFRMTPIFEAPFGPHEWLARTMVLGTGERLSNPDRSQFTYYRVK
jgi:hypothetical protein